MMPITAATANAAESLLWAIFDKAPTDQGLSSTRRGVMERMCLEREGGRWRVVPRGAIVARDGTRTVKMTRSGGNPIVVLLQMCRHIDVTSGSLYPSGYKLIKIQKIHFPAKTLCSCEDQTKSSPWRAHPSTTTTDHHHPHDHDDERRVHCDCRRYQPMLLRCQGNSIPMQIRMPTILRQQHQQLPSTSKHIIQFQLATKSFSQHCAGSSSSIVVRK